MKVLLEKFELQSAGLHPTFHGRDRTGQRDC